MKLNLLFCRRPGHDGTKPVLLIVLGTAAVAALSCAMQVAVPLTFMYLLDHLNRAPSLF